MDDLEAEWIIHDISRKRDNADWGKWLPRELSDDSEPFFCYSLMDVEDAKAEREQAESVDSGEVRYDAEFPIRSGKELNKECRRRARSRKAIQENAASLLDWQKLYLAEHQRVSRLNADFIKKKISKKKASRIKRTPTMCRLLFAFNRDLEPLTWTGGIFPQIPVRPPNIPSVRVQNREAILAESVSVLMSKPAPNPAEVHLHPNDKIICPHCSSRHRVKDLGSHIVVKHPGIDPSTIPGVVPPGKKYCLDCSGSCKLYTIDGLEDHKEAMH
ncbi:hypothetical protein FB45DRAFT_889627 [Roridomyces roridus]|uniref:Uncharacterized protein n=1 Tax=Roridomyces roridus TaxID=1738132 RepID=A0AAD7CL71_9AGAR|nr:hypothetical protein FB45DRAFT_889627 [Roridomyces roridus]